MLKSLCTTIFILNLFRCLLLVFCLLLRCNCSTRTRDANLVAFKSVDFTSGRRLPRIACMFVVCVYARERCADSSLVVLYLCRSSVWQHQNCPIYLFFLGKDVFTKWHNWQARSCTICCFVLILNTFLQHYGVLAWHIFLIKKFILFIEKVSHSILTYSRWDVILH